MMKSDSTGFARIPPDDDPERKSPTRPSSTSPAPAIGHVYMAEARRFIRRLSQKSDEWDVVRSRLIRGPGAAKLRAQLSGSYSDEETGSEPDPSKRLRRSGGSYGSMSLPLSANGDGLPMKITPSVKEVPKPTRRSLLRRTGEAAARYTRILGSILLRRWLNLLLIFLPLGSSAYVFQWGPGAVFFLTFFGLIPLAAMLGDLTEEVARHTGDTLGGIINASFGNIVEMLIGVQALQRNEFRVVQASMLGSVLSNLLLVTGTCFLVGGIYNHEQKFNAHAGVANISLLFLATLAVVVPGPIGKSYHLNESEVILISRVAALCLLSMYLQLIFFQMVTHKHLFEGQEEDEDDDDSHEEDLTLLEALVLLCGVALITGAFSEMLVDSIDGMSTSLNISKVFVGVILLPLVGNATEHMTAVTVAVRNRMELAMGIAIGSATQVAIFVIPFLVLTGWIMNKPMDLEYPSFEVVIFVMSVLITVPVLLTASTNWLLGSFLMTSYLFCAFAFWFEKEVKGHKGET